MSRYAHLHTISNFTFLTGASHPGDYIYRAHALGYDAIAITDECSLAGVVRAFVAAEEVSMKLIIGSTFQLSNGMKLLVIAPSRIAYAELSGFITLARRRAPKGEYEAHFEDLRFRLRNCFIIWLPDIARPISDETILELKKSFRERLWIGVDHRLRGIEQFAFQQWLDISRKHHIPLVASGAALMHTNEHKPLQDVLTAIRHGLPLQEMGSRLESNGEAYLKSLAQLEQLYPPLLLEETCAIADLCHFSMNELRYQYPQELVPEGTTPIQHLRNLVDDGKKLRWPNGVPADVETLLEKELELVEELSYEYYFLTVQDIVRFAREKNILCQGRGSAANSVICYSLFITEIAPGQINVLFERFISRERDEPPDIDVDFEHQRREEVMQYIYEKYGRERAAIAATVTTYRPRSAVRDVGKALGLEASLVEHLAKSLAWWDQPTELEDRIAESGVQVQHKLMTLFFSLCNQILGFPRHLSQHTGGFVISQDRISDLVPLENASMPDRTVIQWTKDDLEDMRLLKVDILALGMLSALRRAIEMINSYQPTFKSISDIPREDPATYDMLCRGDSVGVFQVESRAQMSMLPRLQPRCFYDLIVQIAIVRPGPILGEMVHPYLQRRAGLEEITYASDAIKAVLEPTLGVPIFQEQVMRISMVAAGFSGGEADALRRAMTNWGKNSKLLLFEKSFKDGLLNNGYTNEFAERLFEQVKGFGGYGFPESHSASFALLCYASSWIKCHHPAAFYTALLNSQPMGFYSPSQLVQDARRHGVQVLSVNINKSSYENKLETVTDADGNVTWAIRLGFTQVATLSTEKAMAIESHRGAEEFKNIEDLARRTELTANDLQVLASADALRSIAGDRHRARWTAASVQPHSPLLEHSQHQQDDLLMAAPSLEKQVLTDYQTLGLTLRTHPMALLRKEKPFDRCTLQRDLLKKRHKGFIQVAGIVVSRQRPGTARGTLFVTLEDESGSVNVIVWSSVQEKFRSAVLNGKLLLVKGTIEIATENVAQPVVHIIAGHIADYTDRIRALAAKTRSFR